MVVVSGILVMVVVVVVLMGLVVLEVGMVGRCWGGRWLKIYGRNAWLW